MSLRPSTLGSVAASLLLLVAPTCGPGRKAYPLTENFGARERTALRVALAISFSSLSEPTCGAAISEMTVGLIDVKGVRNKLSSALYVYNPPECVQSPVMVAFVKRGENSVFVCPRMFAFGGYVAAAVLIHEGLHLNGFAHGPSVEESELVTRVAFTKCVVPALMRREQLLRQNDFDDNFGGRIPRGGYHE